MADNYVVYFGFIDNMDTACGAVTACQPINGVFFKIDRSLSLTNWMLVARTNNVQTSSDTGIAISTTVFQVLKIEVNEAGTLATASVDGVVGTTVASDIPTALLRQTGLGAKVVIDGPGDDNKIMYVDYISIDYKFTGDR